MMSSIYSHCFLSIAADGFADGSQGLYRHRSTKGLLPIKVIVDDNPLFCFRGGFHSPIAGGKYLLIDIHSWKDEVDKAPLGTRAWVVQERALSIRTIHFGRR